MFAAPSNQRATDTSVGMTGGDLHHISILPGYESLHGKLGERKLLGASMPPGDSSTLRKSKDRWSFQHYSPFIPVALAKQLPQEAESIQSPVFQRKGNMLPLLTFYKKYLRDWQKQQREKHLTPHCIILEFLICQSGVFFFLFLTVAFCLTFPNEPTEKQLY